MLKETSIQNSNLIIILRNELFMDNTEIHRRNILEEGTK